MIHKTALISVLSLIGKCLAETIDKNTYYSGDLPSDGFTVNSNNFLALVDDKTYDFKGPITINKDASLYIGSTTTGGNGLTSSFSVSGDFNNYGTMVFSDHNTTSGGSLGWTFENINNYGSMFFEGASAATKNPFDIVASTQLINKGLIMFSQEPSNWDSYGNLNSPSLINDGTICLNNIKSQTLSSVEGTGCIVVSANAAYIMQSITHGVVGPQTIFLSTSGSELYCESDCKSDNILVAGFGNGNYITFRTSIDPFRGKWSYNGNTGVLTVKVWPSMTHIFNIGTGYDSSKFKWKQVNNHVAPTLVNNAIYYDGPVPAGAHNGDNCLPCGNTIPWIPTIEESAQYSPYNGDETTTYSTNIQTLTGSDGSITEKYKYYVNTPIVDEVTTSFALGSDSVTTTVSTDVSTMTGEDGKETIKTIYHVETPIVDEVTTSFAVGSDSVTTTVSTDVSTMTGEDGKETIMTIYHVETPIVDEISTSFAVGSDSVTTTVSTDVSTMTGEDGKETIMTIYHVETPIVDEISTSFAVGSDSVTTTVSTDVSTMTGEDGKETIRTIYYVETPLFKSSSPGVVFSSSMSSAVSSSSVISFLPSSSAGLISHSSITNTPVVSVRSSIVSSPYSSVPTSTSNTIQHSEDNTKSLSSTRSPLSDQAVIESTTTSHYSSSGWSVVEVISYYATIDSSGKTIQGVGTEYFADRVDAKPLFVSSQTASSQTNKFGNQTSTLSKLNYTTSSESSIFSNTPSTFITSSATNIISTPTSFVNETISTVVHSTTVTTVTHCSDNICTESTKEVENQEGSTVGYQNQSAIIRNSEHSLPESFISTTIGLESNNAEYTNNTGSGKVDSTIMTPSNTLLADMQITTTTTPLFTDKSISTSTEIIKTTVTETQDELNGTNNAEQVMDINMSTKTVYSDIINTMVDVITQTETILESTGTSYINQNISSDLENSSEKSGNDKVLVESVMSTTSNGNIMSSVSSNYPVLEFNNRGTRQINNNYLALLAICISLLFI